MTVIEAIVQGVQNLPLRQQIEVARYVYSLSPDLQQRRADILKRTHGILDEQDGEAFEQAMKDSRQLERNG